MALKNLTKSLDYKFSLKDKEIYDYKKIILDSFLVTKNKKFSRANSELKNRKNRVVQG